MTPEQEGARCPWCGKKRSKRGVVGGPFGPMTCPDEFHDADDPPRPGGKVKRRIMPGALSAERTPTRPPAPTRVVPLAEQEAGEGVARDDELDQLLRGLIEGLSITSPEWRHDYGVTLSCTERREALAAIREERRETAPAPSPHEGEARPVRTAYYVERENAVYWPDEINLTEARREGYDPREVSIHEPAPHEGEAARGDWHYGAIRMGHRWYATRFHPGAINDGDDVEWLPSVGDTEFWEAGEWHPYSIAAFQERERAAGLLGRPAPTEPRSISEEQANESRSRWAEIVRSVSEQRKKAEAERDTAQASEARLREVVAMLRSFLRSGERLNADDEAKIDAALASTPNPEGGDCGSSRGENVDPAPTPNPEELRDAVARGDVDAIKRLRHPAPDPNPEERCPYCGNCAKCCGEGYVYPKGEDGEIDYDAEKVPCDQPHGEPAPDPTPEPEEGCDCSTNVSQGARWTNCDCKEDA